MDKAAEFSQNRTMSGRVSIQQKRRLLQLMQQHRSVSMGQYTKANARREHSVVWNNVAAELNALGGSNKTPGQWKKCWIDWKASVKKQYNAHKSFARRTGNLPPQEGPKPISDIDREVIDFFSRDMVDGDGRTPEIGLQRTAEIMVETEDETANVNLSDESCDPLHNIVQTEIMIFEEEEHLELPPAQDCETKSKPTRKRTKQSCVNEASALIEEQHVQRQNLLEQQQKEHMDVLKDIQSTLKTVLQCFSDFCVQK